MIHASGAAQAQSNDDRHAPASSAAAAPTLGAAALAFHPCGGVGDLSTAPVATESAGSMILLWVGRGKRGAFSAATNPTDNKGNNYRLLGSVETYAPLWPDSGEAVYASTSAAGGAGHVFTAPLPASDEITLAGVEIKNGGVVQDYKWSKAPSGQAQASLSVTTTGPATLIAIWAGDSDGDATGNVTAVPDNGFRTIRSQTYAKCGVEVFVAAKDVAAPGAYDVTWTATPAQGANLRLIAVQKAR
ncbi:MAG: hypothetical protein ACLPSF_05365 [Methylocella sp.]